MKMFRILHDNRDLKKWPDMPTEIPWDMLNEDMAQKNHGQTLKRLNERGGLGVTECLSNINKTRLQFREEKIEDVLELNKLIEDFKRNFTLKE